MASNFEVRNLRCWALLVSLLCASVTRASYPSRQALMGGVRTPPIPPPSAYPRRPVAVVPHWGTRRLLVVLQPQLILVGKGTVQVLGLRAPVPFANRPERAGDP